MKTKIKVIKVLIVDDSPVALIVLKRIFATSPEIEVVGTAKNGLEALELIPQLQPDVICTDLHMASMNGLEFTREVMHEYPRPILVISSSVQEHNTENIFQLLEAGAVDVFPKPEIGLISDYDAIKQELINKIKILSGVKVFTHRRPNINKVSQENRQQLFLQNIQNKLVKNPIVSALQTIPKYPQSSKIIKILAIGASTGGPQALKTILNNLPSTFPIPIICVQHISNGFLNGLINWLASVCQLPVKIAISGELPQAGTIYFPPERHHLELDNRGKFVCSKTPAIGGHCPSITVTFNSVANFYGSFSAGVLLTGMGRDGADGMQAIAQAGGLTIAQDEASSIIFGMPKEAIALGAAQYILSINDISHKLLSFTNPK
ncbi:MAG: chemotaxis-specific protein-glutamate methyltransferase CheB [Okeania sp. SIO3I5]|uniref:chemotaxis-specific protein-glutamate methyltransferase CheB n=1 Tax=Okeania sp. SIO3I5 TaxID=2607805 RepID=UPI0013BCC12E|nr:chemotaxis-specific protein-glutamate methyltransferase CheB [Okeania sp. SIO3I5]NEQ38381.1 chemotaxis-specific protein-glutamate methyltransferase CheB [Okeania sp. SIO3I5]